MFQPMAPKTRLARAVYITFILQNVERWWKGSEWGIGRWSKMLWKCQEMDIWTGNLATFSMFVSWMTFESVAAFCCILKIYSYSSWNPLPSYLWVRLLWSVRPPLIVSRVEGFEGKKLTLIQIFLKNLAMPGSNTLFISMSGWTPTTILQS
jgi:hypothetical protein